jgi:hypothetical protein
MESTFPSRNLWKDPYATFIGTDGVLLEEHNQKEWCCPWSLIATTSHILALKLSSSRRLMIGSISLLFQIPAWPPFIMLAYHSLPPKGTPWFVSTFEPHLVGSQVPPYNLFALIVLLYWPSLSSTTWCWCTPSPVILISRDFLYPSCSSIQEKVTPDRTNDRFSLEVLTPMEGVSPSIGTWDSSSPHRVPDEVVRPRSFTPFSYPVTSDLHNQCILHRFLVLPLLS